MASILLMRAADFAARKHVAQRRKNLTKDPYINHPIEVAAILARLAASNGSINENVIAAALLHDTLEDTDTTLEELIDTFGPIVATYVKECSDDKSLDKVARKRLQIVHARTVSPQAALIKMADKLSNIKSLKTDPPAGWSPAVVRGYVVWARATVEALTVAATAHGLLGPTLLIQQLNDVFASFGVNEVNTEELEAYYLALEQ